MVVHCGVSGVAKELTLEQLAHNSGYQSKDVKGSVPLNNCCNHNGPDVINSGIEMKKVCDAVNSSSCCVKAVVSKDPGRYSQVETFLFIFLLASSTKTYQNFENLSFTDICAIIFISSLLVLIIIEQHLYMFHLKINLTLLNSYQKPSRLLYWQCWNKYRVQIKKYPRKLISPKSLQLVCF